MSKKAIQEFNGLVKAQSLEIVDEIAANDVIADEVSNANLVFSLSSTQDYYYVSSTLAIKGKVIIPDYYKGLPVRSIYANGFINRTNIEYVKLPKYLLQISGSAFYGCTKLKEIEIPETVTEVGAYAFYNCTALEKVTVHASTPPTLGTSAFVNTPNTCRLSVPPASLLAYKGANWGDVNYGLLQTNFLSIQFDGNAQTATKATNDENGDNIVNTYAKKNGTYPLMTVGGATNAVNAQKTSFSNGSIITIAGGILQTSISLGNKFAELFGTDTEGDFEIQLGTLVGDAALVSFGVVHIDLTASNLPLLSGFAYSDSLGLVLVTATLSVSVDSQTNLPNDLTFTTKFYRFATDAYSNAPAGSLRIRRLK